MNKLDLASLKEKLERERATLTGELKGLGRPVPGRPGDWMATAPDAENYSSADKNSAADRMEDLEEKIAAESELEARLADITAALERMERGAYGVCVVGGEPIEPARLDANPAARTCIKHLQK